MSRDDWWATFKQDAVFGLRQLRKVPVFTLVAVSTLALGIGANTAIFSVIYSVLLNPLPFANGDRILALEERTGPGSNSVSLGNFATWRQKARSFEALGAIWGSGPFTLTGVGDPVPLAAQRTTAGFWKAEFVRPVLGRYFEESDERIGAPDVVVISRALWANRFAADPSIVGKVVTLNSRSFTVVGVAPDDYVLVPPAERVWVPLVLPPERWTDHKDHELDVVGLVKRGISKEQAINELTAIETRLAKEYPNGGFDGGIRAQSPAENLVGNQRTTLLTLLGAVGLVLLIACGNVANLLIARAAIRRGEIAIRAALGASRRRIVTQLLVESLLLGLGGGTVGLGVAAAGVRFLVHSPASIPRLQDTRINAAVLFFTVALSVLCALAFGLFPALHASRLDLQQTLRDGGRDSAAAVRDRTRRLLIVGELCLAQVLLVSAGLLIRSVMIVQATPPGFLTKNILLTSIALPGARYQTQAAREATFDRIAERMAAVPGVSSVGRTSIAPIHGWGFICAAFREGSNGHDDGAAGANVRAADATYFATMGIPVLRGRAFGTMDGADGAKVAIINRGLAKRLYGDADPIGRRIANCIGSGRGEPAWREVVGVIGDIRANGLAGEPAQEVYFPVAQFSQNQMTFVVRSGVAPASLIPSIRRAVTSVDALLPLTLVESMEESIDRSLALPHFNMVLLTLLGATGLILAIVGIYGVISYFVTHRTRELGLRMALGAPTSNVQWLIVRQGLVLGVAGVGLGSALSFVAARLLRARVYGITVHDPLTFGVVGLALLLVAVVASYVPARRATRIDPLAALRNT